MNFKPEFLDVMTEGLIVKRMLNYNIFKLYNF
jgi:hypothetical protein